jgi:3-hydroxyacyl-CoA dehydrogenase
MKSQGETAAVLGAGVMGSAIAAHLAGAGIRTLLLDIVPTSPLPGGRNALALGGLERLKKAKPAAFYDVDSAALVRSGNLEDDLEGLRGCELVIEAVTERLDIKKSLFTKIAPYLSEDVLLASNTSGLSLQEMSAALPPALQPRFCVLHFFNPVRYMRLLEVVAAPNTSAETLQKAVRWGEKLGKGVVLGKDTPNFVANRIGVHSMMKALALMEQEGLSVEEVDKIAGKPMGRPNSAAFRTADLIGIDTFIHVARNCYDALPNDEERDIFVVPSWLEKMAKEGRTGAKAGAGFYKKVGKDILVLDLKTMDYRPQQKVRFESLGAVRGIDDPGQRIRALCTATDKAGQFAWKNWTASMLYSARRIGEIADEVLSVDHAMRWGFNWEVGPFEAWDALGVSEVCSRLRQEGKELPAWVEKMLASGTTSFYTGPTGAKQYYDLGKGAPCPEPVDPRRLALPALHAVKAKVVAENLGASLVDLGDGCLCVEVHSKMNTIDDDVISMLDRGVREAEKNFAALVIGNDGAHFGAGANLMLVYMAAQQKSWEPIEAMIRTFQAAVQQLRYAKVPVVAAPFNYTFGGAAEIAMGADACQAHAETYMGLVEVGVGLVPGGGGCLRMVERFCGPVQDIDGTDLLGSVGQASLNIAMAKVSTGAEEARRMRYLQPHDGISLNRDHLLFHAKQRALGMSQAGYMPPRPRQIKAAGLDAAHTIGARIWGMQEGQYISEHDALIANTVAQICCGGQVAAGTLLGEQDYLDLEREAFLSLCGTEKSQARMQSILMNNKPLRN